MKLKKQIEDNDIKALQASMKKFNDEIVKLILKNFQSFYAQDVRELEKYLESQAKVVKIFFG